MHGNSAIGTCVTRPCFSPLPKCSFLMIMKNLMPKQCHPFTAQQGKLGFCSIGVHLKSLKCAFFKVLNGVKDVVCDIHLLQSAMTRTEGPHSIGSSTALSVSVQ